MMLKPALLLGFLLAAAPGTAAPGAAIGRTVSKAIEAKEPFFTDSERALLRARCGHGADWKEHNIRFEDGVLICSNGRRVDDPEVRAMMDGLGERIRLRVREATRSADIARVTSRRANEQVREGMRRLRVERPHIVGMRHHRLTEDERSRLHADLERMRVDMQRMREEMQSLRAQIRADVAESLRREGVH